MRVIRFLVLAVVALVLPVLFLCALSGCSSLTPAQQASIQKFNAAAGKRILTDAEVAAAAAGNAASTETLNELQADGKVSGAAIGASAGSAAVGALINLDIQRAQAKAPGK